MGRLIPGHGLNYMDVETTITGLKDIRNGKKMTDKDKPRWDGKSRVANDLYRKNFFKIFGEDKFEKEQRELDESYKQSLRNKKERNDKKI